MSKRLKNGKFAVYSTCDFLTQPIDVHREVKRKNIVMASGALQATSSSEMQTVTNNLDWLSWLPWAAKQYRTSEDVKDYILIPTIICPSDIPNRNGIAFPLAELCRFDPTTHRQVYKNWKGCPTFLEHDNEDHTKAKGMVVDSVLRQAKGFRGTIWKVLGLAAFDRTRDPELAAKLLNRDITTVSMGAYVESYSCPICYKAIGQCNHLNPRAARDFRLDPVTGKLIYRRCHGLEPFELSAVQVPAWSVAESTHAVDVQQNVIIE